MANTGSKNPGSFTNDPKKAPEAGRTGGQHQGKESNPANLAHEHEKGPEAGRKGGSR